MVPADLQGEKTAELGTEDLAPSAGNRSQERRAGIQEVQPVVKILDKMNL